MQKANDLAGFSLVLEHIENLDAIFTRVAKIINKDGHIYIGELHPFKQYSGSKARFETSGEAVTECFTHNISDFLQSAKNAGFTLIDLNEYFDDERKGLP